MPIWEKQIWSSVLRLSVLPWCRERLQTAVCCLEWLVRFKYLAPGLDALRFCRLSLSHEGVLGIGRLPVSPMYNDFAEWTLCRDDIGRVTRETISDLDGSLGSRYFLNVANERTCFASWTLLIHTVSTDAFHSTNLLLFFTLPCRYHAPTNGVAPSFRI